MCFGRYPQHASEIYEVACIVCSPKKWYAFVLILKLVRECIGSEAANAGSNLGLWFVGFFLATIASAARAACEK